MVGLEAYPSRLDALHATVAPGFYVASVRGQVLASVGTLGSAGPESLLRLGLACTAAPPSAVRDRAAFADGLLAMQLDVLRRTLTGAMARLDGRVSEGTSLLGRPQVQADLADVAMVIQETAAEPAGTWRGRWACHLRMVGAGRRLLRLFGGHAMLLDSPAGDLYLTEVAGNLYLQEQADDQD
jgi:hypothetical protein